MNFSKEDTKRMLDSLLLLCQDSMERETLPADVYADALELIRGLVDYLNFFTEKEVCAA